MGTDKGERISLLVVDDEPALCDVISLYLGRDPGLSVETCLSGTDAISLLKSHPFDAVVSDYEMPGTDGIALLKHVRSEYPDLPFILFTGRGCEEIAIEALNNGADAFLQKGGNTRVQFTELVHRIRMAVRAHRAESALSEIQERNEALLRSVPEMIFVLSRDGEYLEVRGRPEALSLPPENIVGCTLRDAGFSPAQVDEILSHIAHALDTGGVEDFPYKLEINGALRHFNCRMAALGNDEVLAAVHERTDIIQAQKTVEEQDLKYQTLVSHARIGIVVAQDGDVVFTNPYVSEVMGFSSEEIFKKPLSAFVHPDDLDMVTDYHFRRQKGETPPSEYIMRLCTAGGEVKTTSFSSTLFSWEGRPATLNFIHDVTENLEIEGDLRMKNAAIDSALTPMAIFTREGLLTYANEVSVREWGYGSVADILGMHMDDLIMEDESCGRGGFSFTDTTHPSGHSGYARGVRKDGSDFSIHLSVSRFVDPLTGEIRLLCSAVNVTPQLTARDALQESEERYKTLFESSIEGILVIDAESGAIILANNSAFEIYGLSVPALLAGHSLLDFIPQDEIPRVRKIIFEDMFENDLREINEIRTVTPDGVTVWISAVGAKTEYLGRPAGIISFRDVTELHRHQEALKEINQRLNLLSSITRHDILNQITALRGYSDIIREKGDSAAVSAYLPAMNRSIEALSRQISFTKDYEDLGLKMPSWQSVEEVVRGAASHVSGNTLAVEVETGDLEVFADPMLVKVFGNLIDNTCRHAPDATSICVWWEKDDENGHIFVEDNGPGVPENEKKQIFYRGVGSNTGYGLYLVSEILAITGMTIAECGTPGKGARFAISVPPTDYRL